MEIDQNKTADITNKDKSFVSKSSNAGGAKQRHFRRKTRNDMTETSFPQFRCQPYKENIDSAQQ